MKKIISPYSKSTIFLADFLRKCPAGWTWPASVLVGRLLYCLRRGRRREVERAYQKLCAVGRLTKSPQQLTREFFDRQLMLMTANYLLQGMPDERFAALCDFEGLEHVAKALSLGRGLLVVSFHVGTHLLSFAKMEAKGYPITTLRPAFMREFSDPKLRRMLFIHHGAIYVGDSGGLASPIREVMKRLRDGYVIGIAPDGDQGGGLMNVRVLGGDYPIRRGVVEIARLVRCPLLFAYGVIRNRRYYVHYCEPWYFREDDDPKLFAEAFLDDCVRRFESVILQYPECIWWTRPMSQALGLKR